MLTGTNYNFYFMKFKKKVREIYVQYQGFEINSVRRRNDLLKKFSISENIWMACPNILLCYATNVLLLCSMLVHACVAH